MASGNLHAVATTVVAGIVGPVLVYVGGQSVQHALACVVGCLLGLVLTPDLDVRHRTTHSQAIVRRTAGDRVAMIWFLIWLPYAWLVPYHRHWISHLPIIGTLIRFIYLLAVPALIGWGLSRLLVIPQVWISGLISLCWWVFGGLAFVDGLHIVMDQI